MLRLIFVVLLSVPRNFCADSSHLKLSSQLCESPFGIAELNLSGTKPVIGLEQKLGTTLSEPTAASPLPFSPKIREYSITPLDEVLSKFGDFSTLTEEEETKYAPGLKFIPEDRVVLASDEDNENDTEVSETFVAQSEVIFKSINEIATEKAGKSTPSAAPSVHVMVAVDIEEYSSGDDEECGLSAFQVMRRAVAAQQLIEEADAKAGKEARGEANAIKEANSRIAAEKEAIARNKANRMAKLHAKSLSDQPKREYRNGTKYSGVLMNYSTIESIAELSPLGQSYLFIALATLLHDMSNFKPTEIEKFKDIPASLFLFGASKIIRRVRGTHLSIEEQKSNDALLKAVIECEMDFTELLRLIENLLRSGSEIKPVGYVLIDRIVIPHVLVLKYKPYEMTCFIYVLVEFGCFKILKELLRNTRIGPMILSNMDVHDVSIILCSFMENGLISDSEVIKMIELMTKEVGLQREMQIYGVDIVEAFSKHRAGDLRELLSLRKHD